MSRLFTAFAWMLTLSSSPLLAIDVCLVNDTDQTTLFTVVSGTHRFERQLKPQTHEFVSLAETDDERVVIVQSTDTIIAGEAKSAMKVVGTKVLTEKEKGRWNFCYVHGTAATGLEMELLGFVCLDIVPLSYDEESTRNFSSVKSSMIASLQSTENTRPETTVELRKNIWFVAEE